MENRRGEQSRDFFETKILASEILMIWSNLIYREDAMYEWQYAYTNAEHLKCSVFGWLKTVTSESLERYHVLCKWFQDTDRTSMSKFHWWLPYYANDVSTISNLCWIIMPVHQLWSSRTRRYADLISCFESGLSQWIMGPRHSAAVMLAHIFLERFIVHLYWPFAKYALQSCCRTMNFYTVWRFTTLDSYANEQILV